MFRSREEELVLKKHIHSQLLEMFRNTLTKVSNLKQSKLHVTVSAMFQGTEFQFEITVFTKAGDNKTLAVYDFWEVKKSQKLVNAFLAAIKTGDFEKVTAASLTV